MSGADPRGVVLVVDDDPRALRLIQLVLEHDGYRVLPAADPATARELFLAESPDVVATDLMLPGMNGIDLCRWMRERSTGPRLAGLLLITAMDTVETRSAAAAAGIDDLVTKPVEPAELRRRVHRLLRRADGFTV
jgi:two-component system response regulator MtrA